MDLFLKIFLFILIAALLYITFLIPKYFKVFRDPIVIIDDESRLLKPNSHVAHDLLHWQTGSNFVNIDIRHVESLLSSELQVLVNVGDQTSTKVKLLPVEIHPPFVAVVPLELEADQAADLKILKLMRWILRDPCAQSKQLAVNIGAGMGEYAIFSAKFGCTSVALEAEPRKTTLLHFSTQLNVVDVNVLTGFITTEPYESRFYKYAPDADCWSCAQQTFAKDTDSRAEIIKVESISLDSMIHGDVLLLYIGKHEDPLPVLHSILKLSFSIENIIFDLERLDENLDNHFPRWEKLKQMISTFSNRGYKIFNFQNDQKPGDEKRIIEEIPGVDSKAIVVSSTLESQSLNAKRLRFWFSLTNVQKERSKQ